MCVGFFFFFFANLTHPRVIEEKGTSPEQLPQSYWHVGLLVGHFLKSLIDRGKPSPLWAVTSLGRQTWHVSGS